MATRRSPRSSAPVTFDAAHRVVILRGPDRFMRDAYTRRLIEALNDAHGEIEQFSFDGAATEPAIVLDELRSFGLMQQHKLVIVDQADKFLTAPKETERGRSSSRQLLEKYAAAPVDSATLLLRAETWRPGKLDKAVAKVGTIAKCDVPDEATAASFCVNRAENEYGCSIASSAAAMLVERVGPQLAKLDTELGKLGAYVGAGEAITADAIREMVGLSREEQAWSIQSTLLGGTPATAVDKVRELLEVSRQPEQLLTWAMTDLLRKLHSASQMLRGGTPEAAVAKELRLWGAEKRLLIDRARSVGPAALAGLLDRAIATDQGTKRGLGSSARSLEVLAVVIADTLGCTTPNRPSRRAG